MFFRKKSTERPPPLALGLPGLELLKTLEVLPAGFSLVDSVDIPDDLLVKIYQDGARLKAVSMLAFADGYKDLAEEDKQQLVEFRNRIIALRKANQSKKSWLRSKVESASGYIGNKVDSVLSLLSKKPEVEDRFTRDWNNYEEDSQKPKGEIIVATLDALGIEVPKIIQGGLSFEYAEEAKIEAENYFNKFSTMQGVIEKMGLFSSEEAQRDREDILEDIKYRLSLQFEDPDRVIKCLQLIAHGLRGVEFKN